MRERTRERERERELMMVLHKPQFSGKVRAGVSQFRKRKSMIVLHVPDSQYNHNITIMIILTDKLGLFS